MSYLDMDAITKRAAAAISAQYPDISSAKAIQIAELVLATEEEELRAQGLIVDSPDLSEENEGTIQ